MKRFNITNEGYEEYSEEWKNANTECDFCRS